MSETIFFWVYLFATGCALTFTWLMVRDLWRQRSRKRNSNGKPLRVSHRFRRARRPLVRGYDYPELLLEDMEIRLESNEDANETKIHA
jgi:hypothetical protein